MAIKNERADVYTIDELLSELFESDLSTPSGRRSVIQFHDNLSRLTGAELRTLLSRSPVWSEDCVADAIAAAVCEHHCARTGSPLPEWLADLEVVAVPAFDLTTWPDLVAIGRSRTNEVFARRRVFIAEEALASV